MNTVKDNTEDQEQPTQKGRKKCAEWLAYCLSIGWTRSSLDDLEKLFWKYKDKNGDLKETNNAQ